MRRLMLVAVVAGALLAGAAPARADVTPAAFGGCARADGDRVYRSPSSGLPAAIEQQLGPDFSPVTEVIGVSKVRCVDLTDDGVREMLLELAGPTVSSPEPWAIFRASSGGPPRLSFVRADVGYVTLGVLNAGRSGAAVVERQKTLRSSDFNCCPSGPTKTAYVRWTGRRFRLGSKPTGGSEQPSPPPGPAGDPGPAPPQPSGAPGCEGTLRIGPVDLRATCPRKQADGSYVASGRVRINGMDLVPADGDVEVVLDPKKLELRTTGSVRVQAGPVVLYEGKLERSLKAGFTLRLPAGAAVKGFPLTGEAKVDLDAGAATIEANAAVQALGGVTGAVKLVAAPETGLRVDALKLAVGNARVGAIPLSDLSLAYTRTPEGQDRWEGGATVGLPGPRIASLTGSAVLLDGRFAQARGELSGSVPVFAGITLTKVRAGLVLEPAFGFSGGMALSAGPRVLGVTAASIDGTFTYQSGTPDEYRIAGDVTLVKLKLSSGSLSYKTDGRIDFSGHLGFRVLGAGFDGDLSGFVDGLRAFQAEGDGDVGIEGLPQAGGSAIVSSTGFGACGKFVTSFGFGVRWESFPTPKIFASSCGLDDWRVSGSASAAAPLQAGQERSFRLPGGLPKATFSAVGSGGAPDVTLRGPGGVSLRAPANGPAGVAFRHAADATTYFGVARPRAGTWTLTVEPGSAPVTQLRSSNGIPAPRVRAAVGRARGGQRVLRWRFRARAGREVSFFEAAPGGGRRILATARGRGSLGFTPLAGEGGRRRIVALVVDGGVPSERATVASFKASSSATPGRPGRVRLRRGRRSSVAATWGAARGAARYLVAVRVSDGRRLLVPRERGSRRLSIPGVGRRDTITVRVRALSALGKAGAPTAAFSPAARSRA